MITIRWSLFCNMVILITVLTAAILLFAAWGAHRSIRSISELYIGQACDRIEVQLSRLFDSVKGTLTVLSRLAPTGAFDPSDAVLMNRMLVPLLDRWTQISSVNTGDPHGNGYMLLKEADGWRTREVTSDAVGRTVRWRRWSDATTMLKEWDQGLDYDPRQRPWYQHAIKSSHPVWSDPYTFLTTKDPGITASVRTQRADGRTFVVAFDVMLRDISDYTMNLRPTPQGKVIVFLDDLTVIGLPRAERYLDASEAKRALLSPVDSLGLGEVSDGIRAWRERGGAKTEPFEFKSADETWWAGLRVHRLSQDRAVWTAVFLPASDLLGEVRRQITIILVLAVASLAMAMLMAVAYARHFSRPIRSLMRQSERLTRLDTSEGVMYSSRLEEIHRLTDAQERVRAALDSFARYVPVDVVRQLLELGQAAKVGGETRTLTVLFTDIANFTTIAEKMTPAELTSHMSSYFQAMLDILKEEHATIDKYVGDAIIAFWGAPQPDPDHVQHAVQAVHRCRNRLEELNRQWPSEGRAALPTRFGLATGPVVVGNVGSRSRINYTIFGDTVNLASRLEGLNKQYGTVSLATEDVRQAAEDGFVWRFVDMVVVKGKTEAVAIYDLLGRTGEVGPDLLQFAASYEEAFDLCRSRRFEEALDRLRDLLQCAPDDLSVVRLQRLCLKYQDEAPPDDWDIATRMTEK